MFDTIENVLNRELSRRSLKIANENNYFTNPDKRLEVEYRDGLCYVTELTGLPFNGKSLPKCLRVDYVENGESKVFILI